MPELPEVETVLRAIRPGLEGRRVASARICHPRTARRNARCSDVEERLVGRRVDRVGRLGKFLVIELDAALTWVMHLGMSGRIRLCETGDPRELHTRFWAEMEAGPSVRLVDPRTFGFVAVFTSRGVGRFQPSPAGRRRLGATPLGRPAVREDEVADHPHQEPAPGPALRGGPGEYLLR